MINGLSIILITMIFSLIVFFSACSQKQSLSEFDSTPFKDSPNKLTLCFDLRNDMSPKTGLILKVDSQEAVKINMLALPFNSTNVSQRNEIFSTWGSYGSTTLVGFYTSPNIKGTYELAITPNWGPSPNEWNDDIHDLSSSTSIFFLRYGLIRHFIYKYPEKDSNRKQWLQNIAEVKNTDIDGIAVTLPLDGTGREIKRTGKTTIPTPTIIGDTKIFPADSKLINEEMIYIKYELPPNKNQQLFVEQSIKFVVSIIPLFVQLAILLLRKPNQKRIGRILIWIFAGFQIIIICALIYLAYSNWQEPTFKALADLLTAIITGIFSGLIIWKEKNDSTVSNP